MKRIALILAVLVVLTGTVVSGCSSDKGGSIGDTPLVVGTDIGNLAPAFQLQDLHGNVVTLDGLSGMPVMINFWSTWCIPCRDEMPYIQLIHEEWQDEGLVILAINLRDTTDEIRQFIQENNLSLSVLLDPEASVAAEYDVTVLPVTFFIDKDGIIQEKKIGPFLSKIEIEDCLNKIMF